MIIILMLLIVIGWLLAGMAYVLSKYVVKDWDIEENMRKARNKDTLKQALRASEDEF